MKKVVISNLHKYYNKNHSNEIHVLDDISISLDSTGMVAIFGKSGCGKTTLLNAIGGLDKSDSGTIEIFGEKQSVTDDHFRNKHIGYIFQNYYLNQNETVYDNVANSLVLAGVSDEEDIKKRVNDALESVGLDKYAKRYPDTLSGGQMQRVAIARAIVKNPDIILADEPTGNLDETNTVLVMDILREIARKHLVILVTHEVNLVDYYCDKVIELVDGKIVDVRENYVSSSYISKDKNNIYLKDLEHSELNINNIHIDYYGPDTNIHFQIINNHGKLYLKPVENIRVLDDQSEIRLVNASFEDTKKQSSFSYKLNESSLVTTGKTGSLFTLKSSISQAFVKNFSKKQKRTRRFLSTSLVLLSIILVFFFSKFGVTISEYNNTIRNYNKNDIFVGLKKDSSYDDIINNVGSNGIEYINNSRFSMLSNGGEEFVFKLGNYVSTSSIKVSIKSFYKDINQITNSKLLYGTKTIDSDNQIVITKKVANMLLEAIKKNGDYISNIEQLIGLHTVNPSYLFDGYVIVGIIDSNDNYIYMSPIANTFMFLSNDRFIYTPSQLGLDSLTLDANDTIAYISNNHNCTSYTLYGKVYNKINLELPNSLLINYPLYAKYIDSLFLSFDEYSELEENQERDMITLLNEYTYDYYPRYIKQFATNCLISTISNKDEFASIDVFPYYLYKLINGINEDNLKYYQQFLNGYDKSEYGKLASKLIDYVNEYKVLPDSITSLDDYSSDNSHSESNESEAKTDQYYVQLENKLLNYYSDFIIMNENDYINLSSTAGDSSEFLYSVEEYCEFDYEEYRYSNYLVVSSNDLNNTIDFLNGLGYTFFSYDDIISVKTAGLRSGIILSFIQIGTVLCLLSLCIYFIMKANFMNCIREVGIYRAIGVTKKNILFKVGVESVVVTTLSTFVGYLAASIFITSLKDNMMFSTMFYYPLWMAIGLVIILYLVSLLFGLLPAISLLRKTPSEILSKYDI